MTFPYKKINVLIMPTDYCNMSCTYCFNNRTKEKKKVFMTLKTLEKVFTSIIPYYTKVSFVWHGGEPLTAGLNFYKEAVKLQKEINSNNIHIENRIQTNLSLMNEEIADFLVQNNFRVGSSFDGTQNEKTRHNTDKIIEGYNILRKRGGNVGFICVIQKHNINYLIEDYKWFNEKGINYTLNQFFSSGYGEDRDFELFVPADQYVEKVCELFDFWMYDKNCSINISSFDHFLDYILLEKKGLCCYSSCLGKYIGIRHDGSIYSCDRDFPIEYCYGNVNDYKDIRECFSSKGYLKLIKEAIQRRDKCKKKCEIYDFCTGGCNSTAFVNGSFDNNNDYACDCLIGVYKHIESIVKQYAEGTKKISENMNPVFCKRFK